MRTTPRFIGRTALLALVPLLALSACGPTAAVAPPTTPPIQTLTKVTLSNMKVDVAPAIRAGKYTVTITNAGAVTHELLVFKSDLEASAYPTIGGAIDEEGQGITKTSDGDNLDPGASQTREIDLTQPGKYLFVCNLPGHFAMGMYKTVTVS